MIFHLKNKENILDILLFTKILKKVSRKLFYLFHFLGIIKITVYLQKIQ